MKKALIMMAFLYGAFGFANSNNREPDSPKGNYQFALGDIQKTVRNALIKANDEINLLIELGELEAVAHIYFSDYLSKIASYNNFYPETVDMVESYKTELTNAFVLKEFKDNYPHLIYDESKWMFNSVGGIYANTLILYCSLNEYIVLWGTSLRADNKFSGYYPFMNEFDVMVTGRMESHDLKGSGHAPVIYRPMLQDNVLSKTVDTSNLIPKNVRAYNLAEDTYMVSYAQGRILKAFIPGAIMPGIFVNQDWGGLFSHVKESISSFIQTVKKPIIKDWTKNPNYRAIWIIDQYRDSQEN